MRRTSSPTHPNLPRSWPIAPPCSSGRSTGILPTSCRPIHSDRPVTPSTWSRIESPSHSCAMVRIGSTPSRCMWPSMRRYSSPDGQQSISPSASGPERHASGDARAAPRGLLLHHRIGEGDEVVGDLADLVRGRRERLREEPAAHLRVERLAPPGELLLVGPLARDVEGEAQAGVELPRREPVLPTPEVGRAPPALGQQSGERVAGGVSTGRHAEGLYPPTHPPRLRAPGSRLKAQGSRLKAPPPSP